MHMSLEYLSNCLRSHFQIKWYQSFRFLRLEKLVLDCLMLTRSKLKLGEGELVETNLEIGGVYPRRKMAEEIPLESDSQFMDSFMTMRAMVEEMY